MPSSAVPPADNHSSVANDLSSATIEPVVTSWRIRTVSSLKSVDAAAWDRLSQSNPALANPFLCHAFLLALESTGCVGPQKTGWHPHHVLLEDSVGNLLGAAPAYLKTHSQGEYIFDQGWADAFERAGGDYYPKLQIAVPFTPVPGPRFLVGTGDDHLVRLDALAQGAVAVAKALGVSSLHATFVDAPVFERLGAGTTYLQRIDQQYHWQNDGYGTFDDFLAALSSRKRKTMRKERETALASGLTIRHVTGADITEAHWETFYAFYMDTGSRKWGRPYLTRAFFSELGRTMADKCLLVFAYNGNRPIAGALNIIGGDCLYGRYWGAVEQHPCLHFEVCYYQAIDYAIAHGLPRVEAGAQGDHKLTRGYRPETTYSLHYIRDAGFKKAVARFLDAERAHVLERQELLAEYGPFRKVVSAADA